MSDELITDTVVETEAPAPVEPPPDSLESIQETMRRTQERLLDEGEITPEDAIIPVEAQEVVDEVETPEVRPGLLDKWTPVLQQATGEETVSHETQEQLIDNLMSSWTGLQTKPVDTALAIIEAYIPKEQQAQLVTALTHKAGIDPLDIDVDAYAQSAPSQEVTQRDQQIQNLQNQIMSMQVNQMKSDGNHPLLDNASFAQQMAQVYGQYPDLGLEGAYNFVLAKNPDLATQTAAAVEETPQPQTRRLARRGDILPRGKPNGAMYNDIPKNPVEHIRMKAREIM